MTEEKREYARKLRENQTASEKLLWEHLRRNQLGFKFRRQQVVCGYIADFCCKKRRLIIELDGKFHDQDKDKIRDGHLIWAGYRVIRFPSRDVFTKIDEIILTISKELRVGSPFK